MYKISMFIVLVGLAFSLYGQENVTVPDTTKKQAEVKTGKGDTVVVRIGDKNVILSGNGEEATIVKQKKEKKSKEKAKEEGKALYKEEYSGDEYKVVVGSDENPIMQYIEGNDTIVIRLRRKGIRIIETPDGSTIKIIKDENWPEKNKKKRKRFKGNWQGLELGMNSYLDPDFMFPGGYLSIYDGKAWNVNLNLFQYSLNFSRSGRVGMVTGLGIRFNNYVFANNNNITKDFDGNIVEKPYLQNLKKSKLMVSYVTAPAIIEFHTGRNNNGFRIGLGVVGSLKCKSVTKVKWYDNGDKKKEKNKGDFNISPLDYAFTARFGVKNLDVYANYSMIPLFKKGQGPEVYPLAVGLGFRF